MFTRTQTAVFVDGCFWHGCPVHHTVAKANAGFWANKVRENRARDADTNTRLRALGWEVIRAWEHEPAVGVADRVEAAHRSRLRPDLPS